MRILRVAQDIFPDMIGGAPYHIHALSRDQAERGHEITVLTISKDDSKPAREERAGYEIVRQSPKLDVFGNELFSGTLRYLRNNHQYDVVHAHSHLFYSSNVAAAFARISDIPFAVTCHGLISQRAPELISRFHLGTAGRFTYNSADVTFCYTDVEREKLRDLGVDSDIEVIHNGIDSKRFSPTGDTHSRIAGVAGQTVIFVGRLVEGKRPQDVLSAFKSVHDEHPSARLFFCGSGPMREELEQESKRAGIANAVEFLGRVPYEEMPSVFRAADVFTIASRTEGFPRTVMESLACETPVVSTRLEQTAPVVKNAGEIVPVGDTAALADALSGLLTDPECLSRLGRNGREIVTSNYDWAETVEYTTQALERLNQSTIRNSRDKRTAEEAPQIQ
jgi:glycosyltransferase involved in cell wall biosynthesis